MSGEINYGKLATVYWEGRGIKTWRDWRSHLLAKYEWHHDPDHNWERMFRPAASRVNQLDDELAKITLDSENKVL